jgi:hypothetical protein
MMKLALMRTTTEMKSQSYLCCRGKFVTSLRNRSPNKTDTSQHKLFRVDCMNQAFIVKLLLRNHYTNKKKRLAWAKKHDQWTKSGRNLMSPNLRFMVPTVVF